ncbi:MAG: nitroreductase family protein [Clostridiales bacterium]|jgi:nitroreductase|nr:nitroreductase family protein [Clostridiales bacterium]
MKDFETIVCERRSVRDFLDKPLTAADITFLAKAAGYAPSGLGCQTRRFYFIVGTEQLAALNAIIEKSAAPAMRERISRRTKDGNFCFYYHAPAVVLIADKAEGYAPMQDCCLAMQNLLLAAHARHLGACYLNQPYEQRENADFRAFAESRLGMDPAYRVYAACALGHPDGVTPLLIKKQTNAIVI